MPNPNVGLHAANAATCDPGYYLENGACAACETNMVYCPGDDQRHDCPDRIVHLRDPFPESDHVRVLSEDKARRYNTDITQCMSFLWYQSDRGEFFEYAYWNPETGRYDISNRLAWYAVAPGYYLSDSWTTECGNQAYPYYDSILECPVGSYCPGQAGTRCVSGRPIGPTFGLESCPVGTSTRIPKETSVAQCLPLCDAGVTHLHAGAITAPLFTTPPSTPSLAVRTGGGVCYGNLTVGRGAGINITIAGTTYHVE